MKNIFLIGMLLLSCTATAISLEAISTSPTEIGVDTKFSIQAYLEGDTCSTEVKFYIDDKEVSSKVPGCGQKSTESSPISPNKYGLECGMHEARVEAYSQGTLEGNQSKEIMIGNQPDILITDMPEPDEEIRITFTQREDSEPVEDITIEVYMKDAEDEKKTYNTDPRGEIKFRVKDVGGYTLNIDDSDYCGTKDFLVKKAFTYSGPEPQNPVTGETVSMTLPPGVTVKALDKDGNVQAAATAGYDMEARLTINKAGDYTLAMADASQTYWSQNISLHVSPKTEASITISPDKPEKSGAVSAQLIVAGTGLPSARLLIEEPDNETYAYQTDGNGTVTFSPTKAGTYTAVFQDPRYEEVRQTFEVRSPLKIDVLGEASTEQDITIYVKDEASSPVSGASISVGTAFYGFTGTDARLMLRLKQQGAYLITAKKEGYWDGEKEVKVIAPLKISIEPKEPEYGDPVTIKATDLGGAAVDAKYTITKPDGTTEETDGRYVTDAVGAHKAHAEKEGYVPTDAGFSVKPRQLELGLTLIRDMLVINTTSRGKPVQGITLVIEKPSGREVVKTNALGIAEASIKKDGRIRISANTEDTNPAYGKITIVRDIVKRWDPSSLIFALSAIAVVAIIGIIIVYFVPKIEGRRQFESFLEKKTGRRGGRIQEKKTSEPYFRKGGRSRLSR